MMNLSNLVIDTDNQADSKPSAATLQTIGEILERKTSVAQIMSRTESGLNQSFSLRSSHPENVIFELFKVPNTNKEVASLTKLLKVLRSFGIRENDPRLRVMMEKIRNIEEDDDDDIRHLALNKERFKEVIQPCLTLLSQTLRNRLIIPNWTEFCAQMTTIYNECSTISDGKVATYIPQLARVSPNIWGMSICTIDGQRFSLGDSNTPFCVQSVSKAFNYAIVSSDVGSDKVHQYVGHEPSGRLFNEICLDGNGKPHNPMINAGAIIMTSLIRNDLDMADRFEFVLNEYKKMAGGEFIGFNNATFVSERATADRNYALSYYMKENKCFPPGTRALRDELDLYFQLCSVEATCESAAVMAATLANGGVCPLTDEVCINSQPCRDVLSLMYSCGMYDFSGKFAFQVGLPAKSGVSGVMIVVVPNLMGIALFSPPLDRMGNSCKGVAFCKKLIEKFNFHNYDSLLHADSKKLDPRRSRSHRDADMIVNLLFAAKNGDYEMIRRLYMQGTDLEIVDYDGRTALHIAASEGHLKVVKFLVKVAKVHLEPRDRWQRIPLDDAKEFHHEAVIRFLTKRTERSARNSLQEGSEHSWSNCDKDEDSSSEDEFGVCGMWDVSAPTEYGNHLSNGDRRARRLAAAAVSQSKPAGLTEQQPTQQKQQQLQPMVEKLMKTRSFFINTDSPKIIPEAEHSTFTDFTRNYCNLM
ncbi:hypothetical protein WR25_21635 [Diploscapter pachys]|uniref:glutaminase n=1 Tax=Diploscapter pachys TaxID=2018661 RepID=A0A2A2L215_9BILA|nr:hypothetical protein WR25_21635 [Diploscapter pachys]